MTCKKYLLIGVFALLYCEESLAQLKLPTFDVELKIQQTLMPGEGGSDGSVEVAESTNFLGGAHVQINQHIAVGGFYSRSFRGTAKVHYDNNSSIQQDFLQLQKGFDVRLSTGRAKNWRYYLTINYANIEVVQETEAYRLAQKLNAFGGSLGIMRKLSNNLYLNVIELGVKVLSDEIFWFGDFQDKIILDAKVGVTYNIGKRK